MTDTLEVGKYYKVHLPGESPWAECLAVLPTGEWVGRIDNLLVAQSKVLRKELSERDWPGNPSLPSLHNYKQNDKIIFGPQDIHGSIIWVPAEQAGGEA